MRFLWNIKFAVHWLRGGSDQPCTHVGQIRDVVPNSEGCEQYVAMDYTWVRLRACMTCGKVRCCGSSKNRHPNKHADEAAHPVARSKGSGEDWIWCYTDDNLVRAEVP
jgi:uncharacterized UBP type Zn finger protein